MSQKLWGGRFDGTTDMDFHAFNASISIDQRLWSADIKGSQAYAKALLEINLLTKDEHSAIHQGLGKIHDEWESGNFEIKHESDEDIHTANERRLSDLIGPEIAGKLHTGRSRNDQVATDLRIWTRDTAILTTRNLLMDLIRQLVDRSELEIDAIFPGYTHLQKAQPIRWSHFLLSHAVAFMQDLDRFLAHADLMNGLPLGSGALAGNPFQINRTSLAQELGFKYVLPNSLHAVSDRDFVAQYLFDSSLLLTHISKLAEDLIVYSTHEFGFVSISDAYSTGSSLMPQKKNPDALELLRGKCGPICGSMVGFLMTLKGLPSTYNKDLQEDKEPLFTTFDTVKQCLVILKGVLKTLSIHPDTMKRACTFDMLATDLADYLVKKGIPFRNTHHVAGSAVKLAESRKCCMSEFSSQDWLTLHPLFEPDVANVVFDVLASVDRRSSAGGTAKQCVVDQIKYLRAKMLALQTN